MLCTPPAFILSQDQTLECLYYILLSQVTISLSELFYLSFFYFLEYIYSLTRSVFSHLLMLCTSLFVVQFSMTVAPLSDSLTIIPHHFGLVNTFLKFFQKNFNSQLAWSRSQRVLMPILSAGGPSGTRTPDRPVMSRLL